MPRLRSLHLGYTEECVALLDSLPPLKILSLNHCIWTSLPRHSRSLTSLPLQEISWSNPITGSVAFPSLTYLSLINVYGLKPYINSPCLVTYHEGRCTAFESFTAPLHSLVEYWADNTSHEIDITMWHDSFPNITRIGMCSYRSRLISFVAAFARHLHVLPAVQAIIVEGILTIEAKRLMEGFVRKRSEACYTDVALHFGARASFTCPVVLKEVSHACSVIVSDFLMYITESRTPFVTVVESRVCPYSPRMQPTHIRQ
jgi:hypothetical protein